MNIKEYLKSKITDKDCFEATCETFNINLAGIKSVSGMPMSWWGFRESLRFAYDIYEVTDTLKVLNSHTGAMAHISTEDRNMVAYTPDKAFGEGDRQLKVSIGKLLTKLLPFAKESYIQNLIVDHNGDLTNEVEWLTGANITKAYLEDTSIGACMSKDIWDTHPTFAYHADNIKMAVIRDSSGKLKSRAMCYESGDDKRYIRVYGDQKLGRRLENLGFKPGNWVGVKFNTVVSETVDGVNKVVVPYLDADKSIANPQTSTVALIDGHLTCVGLKLYPKLVHLGKYYSTVPSAAGYVRLVNVNLRDYEVSDCFTGAKLSKLDDDVCEVYYEGQLKYTSSRPEGYVRAKTATGKVVFAKLADTFEYSYIRYIASADNYESLGVQKLSKVFYPEELYEPKAINIVHNGEIVSIKREHAVQLLDVHGNKCYTHVSKIPKGSKKLYESSADAIPCYALPEVTYYKTKSGSAVHPKHNKGLTKTYDGSYEFERNCRKVCLGSKSWDVHKSDIYKEDFTTFYKACVAEEVEYLLSISAIGRLRTLFNESTQSRYVYSTTSTNKYFKSSCTLRLALASAPQSNTTKFLVELFTELQVTGHFDSIARQQVLYRLADMTAEEPEQQESTATVQKLETAATELAVAA